MRAFIGFSFSLGFCCLCLGYFYSLFMCPTLHMNGSSSSSFRSAVHTYKNFVQKCQDRGSSFSVFFKGEHVIDIFSGYSDYRFRLPWTSSSINQAFTISLIAVPFSFAKLYQDGLINIDKPVQKYLPQFSAPNVTISDLLSHQSGFPYFSEKVNLANWRDDYRSVVSKIINQVPSIKPNTQQFHFHSLALLADAIVRQVDPKKRTLAHYFMEEITWPAGLDIIIGIPRTQLYRVTRTYHATLIDALKALFYLDFKYLWINLITSKWIPYSNQRIETFNIFTDYQILYNLDPELLEVPLVSTHMFTNARNLARLFTLLDHRFNNGHEVQTNITAHKQLRIFNETTLDWMLKSPMSSSYDNTLKRKLSISPSGFMVTKSPNGNSLFGMWDDILGQGVFIDPKEHIIWAYTTNHAHGCSIDNDVILSSLIKTVYTCLNTQHK